MFKYSPFALVVAVALGGCGGSSDSVDDYRPDVAPPSTSEPDTFKLHAVKVDGCGVGADFTDAGMLIHDANGAVLSEVSADANGKFEFELPANAKHVTVKGYSRYINWNGLLVQEPEYISFLDVSAQDLGEVRFLDKSEEANCGCRTITADVTDLAAVRTGFILDRFALDAADTQRSMQVCTVDADKLRVQLGAPDGSTSLAARIDVYNKTEFTLSLNDFSHAGVKVKVSAEVAAGSRKEVSQYFTNPYHYGSYDKTTRLASEFVYPSLSEANLFVANGDTEDSGWGILAWVDQGADLSSVKPLVLGAQGQALKTELTQGVLAKSYPLSFDFSVVSPTVVTSSFSIHHQNLQGDATSWRIHGGAKGQLPDLVLGGGEQLSQFFGANDAVSVTELGKAMDLKSYRAERTRGQNSFLDVRDSMKVQSTLSFSIRQ